MTKGEVELAIRKAHLINRALFILKIVIDKLPSAQTDLNIYLQTVYNNLIMVKDEMKTTYKKYDIKLLAPDEDLRAVFNEVENLANSSFPHRALGFVAAVYPDWINIKEVLRFIKDIEKEADVLFSYQLFKDMMENSDE